MNAALAIAHSNDGAYTEARLLEEYRGICARRGENEMQAVALLDQDVARLLHTSGLNQSAIARVIGKTQAWVSYRLQFGQFLAFATNIGTSDQRVEGADGRA